MRQLGRYRLDRVLGAGAFGTVWKGYDPELRIAVAIKILADNWALDADVRERFLAEARLLRQIEDPRVVRVHDVGVHDDRPYFVMDHVEGGTLADVVGRLEPAEALRLAVETAYAVEALHRAGVVHRDVKPGNLLLDRRGDRTRVVVADLGSAKLLAGASGLTVTTGTPAYMAPEQADQLGGFDGRADVYAVAVVTFELLTGRTPYPEVSVAGVARRGAQARPESVAAGLGLPPALDTLVAAALERDPSRRPATARAYGDQLAAIAAGQLDVAPRTGRQWPARVVAAVAVVVFIAALLAVWLAR